MTQTSRSKIQRKKGENRDPLFLPSTASLTAPLQWPELQEPRGKADHFAFKPTGRGNHHRSWRDVDIACDSSVSVLPWSVMFPMETLLKPACSWQHVAGNVMPLWRAAKMKASAGQQPNSTPHRNAWLGLAAPPRFSLAIPRENGSARARILQPPCRTPKITVHISQNRRHPPTPSESPI
jgi:hypothetical protein